MRVQVVRKKNSLIARLKGELDHHTAALFREAVDRELKKESVQNLVLNLQNLTFMDSSGIGAILGRYNRVKEKGGRVVICGCSKHVKKLLQLGGLLKIIPVYSDESSAVAEIMSKS